jgi:deoxyribonucleoside regulator
MKKDINKEQTNRKSFLERIARMYYVIGMKQEDIAEQLNIGRSSVARFLNEARQEGIVQIYIGTGTEKDRRSDLERRLVARFGLKDAVVSKRNPTYSFRVTTATYLNSILPFQGAVGLSGGRTIYSVGEYMHLCEPRPQLKLVQLTGSAGNSPSASVVQSWSDAMHSKPFYLPAPAIVIDKEMRDLFLKNEDIKKTYSEIMNLDLSICGIGNIDSDSIILQTNLISNLTRETLEATSVGDVNLHFFNSNGVFSIPEISDIVVGASIDDLMRIPTRVGMAYGENKVNPILGALKGKIVNILLTDELTAHLLLLDNGE